MGASSSFYESSNSMDRISDISISMQDLEALAKFVQEHLQKPGVSLHSIAERAQNGISHGTVWNIANRHVKEVKERTLVALARGLGVSFEEIQAIVKGATLEQADPFESLRVMFYGWDEASEGDRREVMGALQLIAEGFRVRLRNRAADGRAGKHSPQSVRPGVERKHVKRKVG